MAYVVTDSCINCKYSECAAACPVSCFREGPNFAVIDPDECIDCEACVTACPVRAIFPADSIPADKSELVELNAQLAKSWETTLVHRAGGMPEAEKWRDKQGKRAYLER